MEEEEKGCERRERRNRRKRTRSELLEGEVAAAISSDAPSCDNTVCMKKSGEYPDKSNPPFVRYLDEVACPICMEHPHRAVLLHCGSADRGCRTFICKTGDRHSNCFDQWSKSVQVNSSAGGVGADGSSDNATEKDQLRCPHCRGKVDGTTIVKGVREYLDQKVRTCSKESCQFSGNYRELRKHARREHPMSRPAEVDPSRMEAWRQLERRQEARDTLAALQSAMPSNMVVGDYVVADSQPLDRIPTMEDALMVLQMALLVGAAQSHTGVRRLSSVTRGAGGSSRRHRLWGENLGDREDAGGENGERPRRRRRFR